MKKLRLLMALMVFTILVISGFQFYWLRENFRNEQNFIDMHTSFLFHETVRHLQFSNLKVNLPKRTNDSVRVVIHGDPHMMYADSSQREDMYMTYSILNDKFRDSSKLSGKKMIISLNQTSTFQTADTEMKKHSMYDPVMRFLYETDSLQDSIRVADLKTAFTNTLVREKLSVPFTVHRIDSIFPPLHDIVTASFHRPVSFKLQIGNTFPFIMNEMLPNIIFSVFLLAITLLSFILLYRNLLRQQKLAAMKDDFISNITHELKTPIATVSVAIEALKNFNAMDDVERSKEYLDISSNELQRLSLLVDKVLKLSIFDKKEMIFTNEIFDLNAVTAEVIASMKLQIESCKAEVKLESEGKFLVNGDKLHLQSVIYNLLDNALKYRNGHPLIIVKLNREDRKIHLSVSDNGTGIAPEYREKVFEKFFRIPTGNVHNAKGYGLGLNYVKQVIHKLGGEVHLESKLGQGSTFTVVLPEAA